MTLQVIAKVQSDPTASERSRHGGHGTNPGLSVALYAYKSIGMLTSLPDLESSGAAEMITGHCRRSGGRPIPLLAPSDGQSQYRKLETQLEEDWFLSSELHVGACPNLLVDRTRRRPKLINGVCHNFSVLLFLRFYVVSHPCFYSLVAPQDLVFASNHCFHSLETTQNIVLL